MTTATEAFHEGEQALQSRAGVRGLMSAIGPRVMRDHMPDQHRTFFAQLPWLIAGSIDAHGQPWASALVGPPGFVRSPDARALRVDALPSADDPLAAALHTGAALGLLGIEPPDRMARK